MHITPGSVSITSGVWPDPETSIEPVFYGVGSDLMTLLTTYHQHGEQKHATLGWLKELVEHPGKVLGSLDARHWSERMATMLCMQTTDTSIELYWNDDMLRSRQGSGTPPSVHIPVVEEFADRLAKKMQAEQRALDFEVLNRTASAHFIGGMPIADSAEHGVVDPYQRVFGHPGPARDGRQRHARQPGREPVAADHRARGAGDVAVAEQGRRRRAPAARLGLRAARADHAAQADRARRRARRAPARREEGRHHPRVPVLSRSATDRGAAD